MTAEARQLFSDPDFVDAFERATRDLLGEIVENANPRPSGTDAHLQLRELIQRIAREEIARAAGTSGRFSGLRGDLDRSGAPVVPEPATPLPSAGESET